jgi:type VI protein secretion system component VasK
MRAILLLLADADTDEVFDSWRLMDPSTRGGLIVFGAIGLVTLLALLWAIFLRKSGRRRHSHHHAHDHSARPTEAPEAPNEEGALSPPQNRRRWRRARHRHRSRNPTLAETGGLPPVRPEGPPDPQP